MSFYRGMTRETVTINGDKGTPIAAASIIANDRVAFNICGNRYRLIVSFNYRHRAGHIKFFGTHAQYETIDARSVDTTGVSHGKAKRKH